MGSSHERVTAATARSAQCRTTPRRDDRDNRRPRTVVESVTTIRLERMPPPGENDSHAYPRTTYRCVTDGSDEFPRGEPERWLYLAVVTDLFSRNIVGWSARPAIHLELVLNAMLIAVRRRRPRGAPIQSDRGNPARVRRMAALLWVLSTRAQHESEGTLQGQRRRRIVPQQTADVADYIDTFYNRARRHSHLRECQPRAIRG